MAKSDKSNRSQIDATAKSGRRGAGGPSAHQDELAATNADLGQMFGVDEHTIDRWIVEKPGFRRSVKEGREVADAKVAKSLYLRATGYSHDAVKINQLIHEFGNWTRISRSDAPRREVLTIDGELEGLS